MAGFCRVDAVPEQKAVGVCANRDAIEAGLGDVCEAVGGWIGEDQIQRGVHVHLDDIDAWYRCGSRL